MSKLRKSKMITNKDDIEKYLNITYDNDFNRTFMMETFGDFGKGPKYNPYDIIEIPPGYYGSKDKKNKNTFKTTLGLWVYNKFLIEPELFDLFGYIDKTLTKKVYNKITQDLAYAVLEDRLPLDSYKNFIINTEFLMPFVSILAPNDTNEMLTISSSINSERNKLIKENKDKLEKGDAITGVEVEKKLLNVAVEKLKDDPSMDSYLSGARGSLGNNFKNMYVMKGPVRDPLTNEFNIATSNYNDGIRPEEYHIFANSLAAGPYARTNKTKIGGYWEKLFVSAFQHIKVYPGDCGTKKYIEVTLNDPSLYAYSYIIEGDKLVELTSDKFEKYKGKKVKLRYSSMCERKDGICNTCAGNLFNRLGITNIGLALPVIPSKLKVIAMKSFHDSTSKFTEIDLEKAFGFDGKIRKK